MKLISRVILIVLYFTFTNLSFVYATNKEKLSIIQTTYTWMKINKRIPTQEDFNSDSSLPIRYPEISKKFDMGLSGEFKEMLLDLDKKNGGKFTKIILKSQLSQKFWLDNTEKRKN